MAILLATAAAFAQAPAFEVVSIKVSAPQTERGASGGPGRADPTRYTFNSAMLLDLIAIAWHVDYFQISSKTPLDQNRFDFAARVPAGATRDQLRLMMQAFLADRFHLKQHLETRDFPGFALVAAKSGTKLKESSGTQPGMRSENSPSGGYMLTHVAAQQQTMKEFADWLPSPDSGPIVDATGLTGKYDFSLEFTRDLPGAAPETRASPPLAPDLFTALQQQLGLQLQRRKIPLTVVVVESVSKLPTAN